MIEETVITNEEYVEIYCLEDWLERKGWSLDLGEEEQGCLEAEFAAEYGNVRSAMWERHYRSLGAAERALLDAGTHPSYSWDLAAEAKPYLEELQSQIAASGLVANVGMSYYHGHSIAFTVRLSRNLHWREYRRIIPEFYRGFQVFVVGPGVPPQPDV